MMALALVGVVLIVAGSAAIWTTRRNNPNARRFE